MPELVGGGPLACEEAWAVRFSGSWTSRHQLLGVTKEQRTELGPVSWGQGVARQGEQRNSSLSQLVIVLSLVEAGLVLVVVESLERPSMGELSCSSSRMLSPWLPKGNHR